MLKDEFPIGTKQNRLTVIEPPFYREKPRKRNGKMYKQKVWFAKCKCECGQEYEANIKLLKHNKVKSCGCLKLETDKLVKYSKYKNSIKHPIYNLWKYMKSKEIDICEDWLNYDNFYNWAIDTWQEKYALSLDGNKYCPKNCELIPRNKQIAKSRSKNGNLTRTPLYNAWSKMRLSGVDIYNEWDDFLNFYNWSIDNGWTEGSLFLRRDVEQSYNPENCFFGNEKDKAIILTEQREKDGWINPSKIIVDGKTLDEHCDKIGITRSALNYRIAKYGIETAICMKKNESGLELLFAEALDNALIKYNRGQSVEYRYPDFIIDNIIVETDGLYWHCDKQMKNDKYHADKRKLYLNNGYFPLFFREDEVNDKLDICLSILKNKLGLSRKIYARKCNLIELNLEDRKKFFEENHLMGQGSGRCLALEYQGEVVCAIRYVLKKDFIDISRFCTKLDTSVVGGYSRLLSKLEGEIRTFVDLRYGSGEYLLDLGFKQKSENLSFKWTDFNKTYHRMKFPGNSGYENGYYKIWDCGQRLFVREV